MRSLVEIYESYEKEFTTTQVDKDEQTGAVTWDVGYHNNLDNTYKDLTSVVRRMERLIKERRTDDKIKGMLATIKTLKNRFSRHRKFITKDRND